MYEPMREESSPTEEEMGSSTCQSFESREKSFVDGDSTELLHELRVVDSDLA